MKNFKTIFPIFSMLVLLSPLSMASEDCQPGYAWDNARNRCVYTQSSINNQSEFESCDKAENKESCIEEMAKKRADKTRSEYGDEVKAGDVADTKSKAQISTGIMTAFSAISAVQAGVSAGGISGVGDMSLASKIFGGTSLAGWIKSTWFEKDVEKKTKDMRAGFEKDIKSGSFKDAQLKAFDYLEEEQSYLQKHSKEQKKYYNMIALGYTASSIAAAYEIYTNGWSCSPEDETAGNETTEAEKTDTTKPESKPEVKETKTDVADADKATGSDSDVSGGGDTAAFFTSLGAGSRNPCVILPVGILLAGYSYKLGTEAGSHAKEAGENVGEIQKLKEKYVASIANYCPDGREDLKKPYCYCYLSGGDKNPNREKSQTCQNIWNYSNGLYADSTDFLGTGGNKHKTGCVFVDGKFDPSCSCKKLKNSAGKNACMNTTMPRGVLSQFGNLDVSSGTDGINNILSGNSGDNAIGVDVNGKAAIAETARDALVKKINPTLKKELGGDANKIANKFMKDLNKRLASNGTRISIMKDPKAALGGSRPQMKGLQKAIKKAGGSTKALAIFKGGKSSLKSKSKKKKNKYFNFGSDEPANTTLAQFDTDDSVMKKKFKYNNDINNDKDVSIFKVISNRYSQSGLKRLFSEELGE